MRGPGGHLGRGSATADQRAFSSFPSAQTRGRQPAFPVA